LRFRGLEDQLNFKNPSSFIPVSSLMAYRRFPYQAKKRLLWCGADSVGAD
jgi:hypothetical protein